MKKEYFNPEIIFVNFESDFILTASVVVGTTQPGDETIDGSDLFA